MIRVNYHLTDGQLSDLRALSEKTGLSVAEWVRRAVDALLERESNKEKSKDAVRVD